MKSLLLMPLALLLSAGSASALTASYNDFSSTAGLTLNGNAAQSGNVLRLVPNVESQAGSAYLDAPLALDGTIGFSTSFSFLITTDTGNPTDGFAFVLQNNGAIALGAGGQGLGYATLPDSVAVVFRGRDPNLIGVITGGTDPADLLPPFQPPGFYTGTQGEFYNQTEYAWIDYTPVGNQLSVYLSTTNLKPVAPIMSTMVNVLGAIGTQAYVGFSAGNGGGFGDQDILSWQFSAAAVPEPGAAAMLALGLAVTDGVCAAAARAEPARGRAARPSQAKRGRTSPAHGTGRRTARCCQAPTRRPRRP